MKMRKRYIFITDEGFTYQPNSEAIEPDIENMQVLGFGEGVTPEKALGDMLIQNKHLQKTSFTSAVALEVRGTKCEYFTL